ncbi:copper chaperone for superoxide dismutase isoform X2 [Ischnura elegans]|uniref:copper chaperone for superoxide dismutase isoform X2 n=1 Tax=Ischnura elegans TaxID=197161 RepID=UPI001ED8B538|nr:copper chaperone for superoxide dismutase isoform X2 [Ischnura elegans]
MIQVFRSMLFPKVYAMDGNASISPAEGLPSVTTMEFAVQMHCNNCAESVKSSLAGIKEISKVDVSLEKESVVVETTMKSGDILKLIEGTGKKVVLKGIGSNTNSAAVAVVGSVDPKNIGFGWSDSPVCGVVRFIQATEKECIIEGVLDGLSPGPHGLHVHECGDISQGCYSIGSHYNPFNTKHGGPNSEESCRHVGDLGNVIADENGRATFRLVDNLIKTWDLIGRSVAVTEGEDDLGLGDNKSSIIDGNSGRRLACGIIARSAGLFENPKRICACDGVTIWDEASGVSKDKKNDVVNNLEQASHYQKSKY